MIRSARRCAIVAIAGLLAACAAPPRVATPADDGSISGRMAVRVEGIGDEKARNVSAAFDLRGDAQHGALDLTTPLGTVLAQARWSPDAVLLKSPDGLQRYADLDGLTRAVLGESIPVAALFDWLRGRPWPGAANTPTAGGFDQLGWHVDLARLADATIVARRERAPAVTVRAILDR